MVGPRRPLRRSLPPDTLMRPEQPTPVLREPHTFTHRSLQARPGIVRRLPRPTRARCWPHAMPTTIPRPGGGSPAGSTSGNRLGARRPASRMKAAGSLRAGFPALHGGTRRRVTGGAKRPKGRARRSRACAAGPSVPGRHSRSSAGHLPLAVLARRRSCDWRPTHDKIRRFRGQRRSREDRTVVSLQDAEPGAKVVGMTNGRRNRKFGAQEGRTQFSHKLLARIGVAAARS